MTAPSEPAAAGDHAHAHAAAHHFAPITFSLILHVAATAEVMMYAIAQKEQLGFDKAVEECKYRM